MLFEQVSPFNFSVPRPGVFGLGSSCQDPPGTGFGLWSFCSTDPPAPAHPGAWCGLTQPGLLLLPRGKGSLPPSCWLLGVLMLLKQRDAPCPPPACVGTWGREGRGKCSAPVRNGLTPSLPWGVSALCFGLLYPLSHSARGVARAQVESFSVLAALLPCHQLGDLSRVMVPREAAPAPLLPWGQRAASSHIPAGDSSVGLHLVWATLQHTQALITLWFLSLLFKNKTKKRQKKSLNCFYPLCVPVSGQQVLQGTRGARHLGASPCVSCL